MTDANGIIHGKMLYKSATISDINIDLVFPCYCCQNNKNGDLREASPTCWDKCQYDRGQAGKSNFRPFITLDGCMWTEIDSTPPQIIVDVVSGEVKP